MQHCRESWGLWTIVLEAVRYTTVTLLCVKPQIVLSTCFIYLFFCLVIWIFYILRHYRSPIDIIFCSSVLLLQKRFSVEEKLLVVLLGYTIIQSSAPLRLIPLVENECVGKPGPVGLFLCVCVRYCLCVWSLTPACTRRQEAHRDKAWCFPHTAQV